MSIKKVEGCLPGCKEGCVRMRLFLYATGTNPEEPLRHFADTVEQALYFGELYSPSCPTSADFVLARRYIVYKDVEALRELRDRNSTLFADNTNDPTSSQTDE